MQELPQKKSSGALAWLILSAIIIALDQWSKYLIQHNLELYQLIPVTPFFDITHWRNQGVAFSLFENYGASMAWLFILIAVVISAVVIIWLYRLPKDSKWLACALALVLGGAIGNLLDRLFHGYVIDFMLLYWHDWSWPAFNVADVAISVGVVMLVIDMFKK